MTTVDVTDEWGDLAIEPRFIVSIIYPPPDRDYWLMGRIRDDWTWTDKREEAIRLDEHNAQMAKDKMEHLLASGHWRYQRILMILVVPV